VLSFRYCEQEIAVNAEINERRFLGLLGSSSFAMKREGYGRGGRNEYISLDGLRVDGRRPEEVRHIACHIGTPGNAIDGNAYFEQGNTRVLATVVGPRDRKSVTHRMEEGMELKCNYSNRQDRRSAKEIEPLLEDMFRSVILVDQYPKSRLDISIEVIQADGSLLCAAVNAVSLALVGPRILAS